MGDYAFGEEDDELEHVVVRLLRERSETLAVAESATGGLLAHRMTAVRGHEACFRGTLVIPRGEGAGELLGVSALGARSAAEVRGIAESCLIRFHSDWGARHR